MTNCEYCGKPIEGMLFKCKYCTLIYYKEHRIPEEHLCTAKVKPTSVTLKATHGTGIFYKDQKIKEAIPEEAKAPFQNWMIWAILGIVLMMIIQLLIFYLQNIK